MANRRFAINKPDLAGRKSIQQVLIICEGKTEYEYFLEIRQKKKSHKIKVHISNAKGDLDCKRLKNQFIKLGIENVDKVFVVFDRESPVEINNLIRWLEKTNKHWIVSNPCFELWILLHIEDQHGAIKTANVLKKVKGKLDWYKKGCSGLYSRLESEKVCSSTKAIERTSLLYKMHMKNNGNLQQFNWNPYTNLPDILQAIMDIE